MNRKRIPLVVLAVVAIAFAVWWFGFRNGGPEDQIKISGNIELTEVKVAFKTPGKLVELNVEEGQTVKAGDVIGRLDTAQLESQKRAAEAAIAAASSRMAQLNTAIQYQQQNLAGVTDQREAEVAAAKAQLDELLAGARTQEREQARAAVSQAEAEAERAAADWKRAQTLFASEDITAADRDRARAAYEATQATLRQAKERQALVLEGPRQETIATARAQVNRSQAALRVTKAGSLEVARLREEINARQAELEQARANLQLIETQLADAVTRSPIDGVVLVKAAETGEVLAAGTTVATIADLSNPWLRGYLGERYQGRVRIGMPVEVRTDSFPDRVFEGRLSYISSEAEFTPKQIQTEEERVKLVFRIKIDLKNPEGALKANMPADAYLPLIASAGERAAR